MKLRRRRESRRNGSLCGTDDEPEEQRWLYEMLRKALWETEGIAGRGSEWMKNERTSPSSGDKN